MHRVQTFQHDMSIYTGLHFSNLTWKRNSHVAISDRWKPYAILLMSNGLLPTAPPCAKGSQSTLMPSIQRSFMQHFHAWRQRFLRVIIKLCRTCKTLEKEKKIFEVGYRPEIWDTAASSSRQILNSQHQIFMDVVREDMDGRMEKNNFAVTAPR